jgi:hypothetical protein
MRVGAVDRNCATLSAIDSTWLKPCIGRSDLCFRRKHRWAKLQNVKSSVGDPVKQKSSKVLGELAYQTETRAADLLRALASIEAAKSRRAILNLARQLAVDRLEAAPSAKNDVRRQLPAQTPRKQ